MRPVLEVIDDDAVLRTALEPTRRALLERLGEPASATQLAAALGLPRQRVNHHLRALEAAGLVELVEERPRRGLTERLLRRRADVLLVDPAVMAANALDARTEAQDRHASEHLVATGARLTRDVGRMHAAARREGTRLLTFTVEAEVALAAPADVERLADALAGAVGEVAERFAAPGGRRFRLVLGGHPAPPRPEEPPA